MTNIIKKTSWLLFALCIPLLHSCRTMRQRAFYNYHNITLERVDYNIETYFYCYKDGIKQPGYVYTRYYGMQGTFDGGLVFKPDGRVLFLEGDVIFKIKDKASFAIIRRWNGPAVGSPGGKPIDYEVGQKGVYYINKYLNLEHDVNAEGHADPGIRAVYFYYDEDARPANQNLN